MRVGIAPAVFTSFSLLGTNIVIAGANGTAGGRFEVLTSTNLLIPVTSWTSIATQNFDGSGNFNLTITNAATAGAGQQFYLLSH